MTTLTPEQVKETLERLGAIVKELRSMPLDEMEEAFEHESAFGCFFDPTEWMRNRANKEFNRALVRGGMSFLLKVTEAIQRKTGCKEKVHPHLAGICPFCGFENFPMKEGADAPA